MPTNHPRRLKILLINPTFMYYKAGWPPLGLAYLAAALRAAGHRVRIYDPTPTKPETPFIKDGFHPDLIGISVVTSLRHAAQVIAERVKKEFQIPIVVGGPDVTSSWQDYMEHPAIDFAVIGEGEQTIVELANGLVSGKPFENVGGLVFKRDGDVVENPPRAIMDDVDEAPMPARDLLDMGWYRGSIHIRGSNHRGTTLMSARGCPWNCSFCDSRHTWTRRYRTHSDERVAEEIVGLLRDYKTRTYQFLDDTFPVNHKRTLSLCNVFAHELRGIRWACQARVDRLDEEVLVAMKEGGCVQVEFGAESGSDRILERLNKGFDVDQIRKAFALCRKHKVRTYANFILGAPHETEADVRATFDLYKELNPNSGDLWIATPYPGTDLYHYCEDNGLLADDYRVDLLHHGHELGGQCFIKSELSKEDIERLRMAFYDGVRKDWDYEEEAAGA